MLSASLVSTYYTDLFQSKNKTKLFCHYPKAVLRPDNIKTNLFVCQCPLYATDIAANSAHAEGADVVVLWEALYNAGSQPTYRYYVFGSKTHNIDWLVSKYGGTANISMPGKYGWFDSMITPVQVEHLFT